MLVGSAIIGSNQALPIRANLAKVTKDEIENCCDQYYESYHNSQSDSYYYDDYRSWPSWMLIDGKIVNCKERPMDCFDEHGRDRSSNEEVSLKFQSF